jgi:hypothetical protein
MLGEHVEELAVTGRATTMRLLEAQGTDGRVRRHSGRDGLDILTDTLDRDHGFPLERLRPPTAGWRVIS